jgi:allantoin racemase
MRIGIVNPNTTESMTDEMVQAARAVADSDTELVGVTAEHGPATIEGYIEDLEGASAVVDMARNLSSDIDALVIGCFGDTGILAARELLDVPVVGAAEASFMAALTVGHRFSVLTTLDSGVPLLEDLVDAYGHTGRCASVRATGVSVAAGHGDREATRTAYLDAGRKALSDDGADVLCLGCAALPDIRDDLEDELGAPVIDAVPSAVVLAEAVVRLGLRTSKIRAFKGHTPSPTVGGPS